MALIKCPECGREVSNKAQSCPNCAYPLAESVTSGPVRIKMPNNTTYGFAALFTSRDCYVADMNNNVLWRGELGENAKFELDVPTKIIVDLGSMGNPVEATVEPKKKYAFIQDTGIHWKATYRLTEVDVIDSD